MKCSGVKKPERAADERDTIVPPLLHWFGAPLAGKEGLEIELGARQEGPQGAAGSGYVPFRLWIACLAVAVLQEEHPPPPPRKPTKRDRCQPIAAGVQRACTRKDTPGSQTTRHNTHRQTGSAAGGCGIEREKRKGARRQAAAASAAPRQLAAERRQNRRVSNRRTRASMRAAQRLRLGAFFLLLLVVALLAPMPMTEARGESAWVGWGMALRRAALPSVCGDELGALERRRRISSGNSRALNQPQAMHLITHLTPPHFPPPTPIHSPAGPAVGRRGRGGSGGRLTVGLGVEGGHGRANGGGGGSAERGRRQPEHQRQR